VVEHKTWTTIDKTNWGDGPWQTEPDKEQWTDPETGFACLAVRHDRHGYLCGYVGMPPGHPWHGADPETLATGVHGGTDYGAYCEPDAPEGLGICHIPEPGDPDPVWWIGFACAHIFDIQPGRDARLKHDMGLEAIRFPPELGWTEAYRTIEFVRSQCAFLAAQAAKAAKPRRATR